MGFEAEGAVGGNEGRGVNEGGKKGGGGDRGEMKGNGKCGVCGGFLVLRHAESDLMEK